MFRPESAKRIIDILQKSSYKAYAVGGCVRDAIMQREVGDYDITTSALPLQVEEVLKANNIKFVETGLKHGTITAVIDHIPYEITTFRTDGKYSDNRHPESVSFVSDIKEDLSRRDFTVNAIAYNELEGFVDLFGGRKDIERRLIKTVGNADERFNEDALRIMRALRFASQLSFDIEEETKHSIFRNKELLCNIAIERFFIELKKLLLGDNCVKTLGEYKEVIRVVIPELNGGKINAMDFAPKKLNIRLAILLTDCKNAPEVLKRLKVSNEIYNGVIALLENSYAELNSNASIKQLLNKIGEELFFDLIEYKKSLLKSENKQTNGIETAVRNAQQIIENNEPYKISDLAINGFDLMNLGYQGKDISAMLEKLLAEVIANPEKNKKDILLNLAK